MIQNTKIDIIRHGEPVGGSRFRGHGVDDPLSEKGWEQMWNAVGDTVNWSRVITSPLRRCREFSEALAKQRGLPLEVIEQIKEVGFGDWEGRVRQDVKEQDYQAYKRFYADPVNARPAGAEPLNKFFGRVTDSVREIMQNHPGEHLLIVAHAGVVRSVVNMVLGGSLQNIYAVRIEYAQVSRIAHSPDLGLQLVFHARTQLTAE